MLKAPSAKLSGKDKAAVVAKELGDFLGHYKRETELFTVFREESGMIPRHIFEEFVAFASDSGYQIYVLLLVIFIGVFKSPKSQQSLVDENDCFFFLLQIWRTS